MDFLKKPYVKLTLKLLITGAGLYYVSTKIDFDAVWRVVKTSQVKFLLVALFFFAASKLIAAVRLNYYYKHIGVDISERVNVRLYLLGMFYNLFLPGGIGGDGYKIYKLNKASDVPLKKIATATLLDRVSGLAAIAINAGLVSLYLKIPDWVQWVWLLIPLTIVGYALGLRFVFRSYFKLYVPSLLLAWVVQTAQLVCCIFILKALGLDSMFWPYLFVFYASSVLLVLPIPSMGGLGVREIVLLFGAGQMDLGKDISVSLSLMFFVISAIVSAVGAYYAFDENKIGLLSVKK